MVCGMLADTVARLQYMVRRANTQGDPQGAPRRSHQRHLNRLLPVRHNKRDRSGRGGECPAPSDKEHLVLAFPGGKRLDSRADLIASQLVSVSGMIELDYPE